LGLAYFSQDQGLNMFKLEWKDFKTAISLFFFLTLITGFIYPLLVTGLGQLLFPEQANGSLVKQGNKTIGSLLIGQSFTDAHYFWGRPSATSPFPYNGARSSGSNLGPSNPAFIKLIQERVLAYRHSDLNNKSLIPVDLITASGSGLDPEISLLAAFYQIPRIAKIRHLDESELSQLVREHRINRTFGILGEPRVNVLQLNLALDQLRTRHD
jgi:K+-transporting ATPase ATPase C chain